MDMDLPRRSDLAKYWQLDKNTVFLNHGSFGATPIEILNKQDIYRQKIEKDPVKFFERDYVDYWKKSIILLLFTKKNEKKTFLQQFKKKPPFSLK